MSIDSHDDDPQLHDISIDREELRSGYAGAEVLQPRAAELSPARPAGRRTLRTLTTDELRLVARDPFRVVGGCNRSKPAKSAESVLTRTQHWT